MNVRFEESAMFLEPKTNVNLDELTELAHYYLQFLPNVKVEITTSILGDKQIVKYSKLTEEEYKRFIEESKLV